LTGSIIIICSRRPLLWRYSVRSL